MTKKIYNILDDKYNILGKVIQYTWQSNTIYLAK